MSFKIGQSVRVKDDLGVIKFVGTTSFAPGVWYGIELQQPRGKNNGSVQGVKYFDCKQDDSSFYGVFVREGMLNQVNGTGEKDSFQLNQIIVKLQTKLKTVTSESAEYRNNFWMLQTELEKKLKLIGDLESKLEMQNVNNDFLQLVKLQLEEKLQDLAAKYQELSKEFDLIQEELEVNREIEKEMELANIDEFTPREIKLIVERNRRVEDTLALLMERSQATETKLRAELSDLQARLTHAEDVEKKLEKSESTIAILQERIETFADMEKMMERLTVENDELNNKIKNLTTTINELNEINELDKNLEEDMRQTEIELRQEIEEFKKVVGEDQLKIGKLQEEITKQKQEAERQISRGTTPTVPESELFSLRQTISELKLRSRADAVQLRLVKGRYEVLLDKRVTNADLGYRSLMDLLLTLKVYLLDMVILQEFVPDKCLHQKIVRTLLSADSQFFELLITILEHNYDMEGIETSLAAIKTELDKLGPAFDKAVSVLLSDDLSEGVLSELQLNLQSIQLFAAKCSSILDLGFHSTRLRLGTRECFRNLKFSNMLKGSFLTDASRYLKSRVDDSHREAIDNVIKKSQEFKSKAEGAGQDIHLAANVKFRSSDVDFQKQVDMNQLLEVYLVLKHDNLEVPSEAIQEFLDHSSLEDIDYAFEVEVLEVGFPSVYEYTPAAIPDTKQDHEALGRLQEVIDLREREINDLRLNINLLEQNMLSLASQNSLKVTELNQTLDALKFQEQRHLDTIAKLEQEKKDLLKELDLVEQSTPKTIEFKNLASQKEYNSTVTVMEKIIHLKNVAKKADADEQFDWLRDTHKSKPFWTEPTPLQQLSRELRSIALDIKPILINPTNKYVWKKLTNQPKFINLVNEERYAKYNSIKSNLFDQVL
ncbi:Dynactin, isoform [Candida viswanathii]|uniref:Dynactin, isoform n=1 Tax=Candida viswanathii TaxID=5486 RepID=A0A367XZK9_9ASCO|nr:Dynactin, isoform [Candida viswanathii]